MIVVDDKLIPATIEQVILDLKKQTGYFKDIVDVGDDVMVTCPSHAGGNENNPSCGILKEDKGKIKAGTTHCYTCNYIVDLPTLVKDVKGYQTRQDGLQWLIRTYTSINPTTHQRPPLKLNMKATTPKPTPTISDKQVKYFNDEFNRSKYAQDYMMHRKISKKVCNDFKIGYNKRDNTIMIPVTQDNDVIFYKERGIGRRYFKNQKGINKAEYIFGLDKAIQNYKNDSTLKVWICESEIDALTVYENGDTAIAIMGSHISNKQIELLANSPIRRLVDGMDRDYPGRKGMKDIRSKLYRYGFRFYNTNWTTKKKDINELTKEEYKKIKEGIDI